jgi:hypothetical protein
MIAPFRGRPIFDGTIQRQFMIRKNNEEPEIFLGYSRSMYTFILNGNADLTLHLGDTGPGIPLLFDHGAPALAYFVDQLRL